LKNSCDNRQIHQIKINTHNFYLVGQCTFSPTPVWNVCVICEFFYCFSMMESSSIKGMLCVNFGVILSSQELLVLV
jgi:hypothetical protein